MADIGKDLKRAQAILEKGELLAIPTETVYGLAGNAYDPKASAKIFEVKNRPAFDPLIVHTNEVDRLIDFVMEIPEKAKDLAKAFWPGPLTIILPKKDIVPDIVTAGFDTVAVRIPDHPLTLKLLENLDFPLASPSANPFGYISPTRAEHVNDQLGDKIEYIIDGGPCKIGLESTIIGFEDDTAVVYRLGGKSIEELEKVVGPVVIMPHSSSNPKAPGMLKSHYAPNKPFIIGNTIEELLYHYHDQKVAVLSFNKHFKEIEKSKQIILSEKSDMFEAAHNLFSALRNLDKMDVDVILAEYVPETGLGRAINDRLRRAAAKS
jgi:L-threonylcarbamoyladenylate synthase